MELLLLRVCILLLLLPEQLSLLLLLLGRRRPGSRPGSKGERSGSEYPEHNQSQKISKADVMIFPHVQILGQHEQSTNLSVSVHPFLSQS
jgi:hypothetical protein